MLGHISHLQSLAKSMQILLTIVAISFALLYLGREFYKRFFGKNEKCDGCGISKSMEK